MVFPQAQLRRAPIHCDDASSVIAAIEESWTQNHAGKPGRADFTAAGRLVYVFDDAARFKTFQELKDPVAHRVALSVNPVPDEFL